MARCCRPQPAVKISSPSTGISLEVATTSPGLQFYSGGLLSVDALITGKGGTQYPRFGGFAVETQVAAVVLIAVLVLMWSDFTLLRQEQIQLSKIGPLPL